jgi:hypothetical protein
VRQPAQARRAQSQRLARNLSIRVWKLYPNPVSCLRRALACSPIGRAQAEPRPNVESADYGRVGSGLEHPTDRVGEGKTWNLGRVNPYPWRRADGQAVTLDLMQGVHNADGRSVHRGE